MGDGVETSEAPEWLVKLEKQREKLSKARLGHDSGAGAPCNTCGSKCPGLELHFWRKMCRACHCSKDVHDVRDDELAGWAQFQLLGHAKPLAAPALPLLTIKGVSEEPVAVEWIPPDVPTELAVEYLQSLGRLAPVAGSPAARRLRENRRHQVPVHDVSAARAEHATPAERREHEQYVAGLRAAAAGRARVVRLPPPVAAVVHAEPLARLVAGVAALDVAAPDGDEPPPPPPNYATHPDGAVGAVGADGATACGGCGRDVAAGGVAVRAERLAAPLWHPACFACATCGELLADLVYVSIAGAGHCVRDAAAALGVPRCAGCDELIFARPYTAAEGRAFHVHHFCCYRCDVPLGGGVYVPDAESGLPACLPCYEAHHAERCRACAGPIRPEQQGVSWAALHWHADCFVCSGRTCARSLLSGKFLVKKEMPFCSVPCVRSRVPA